MLPAPCEITKARGANRGEFQGSTRITETRLYKVLLGLPKAMLRVIRFKIRNMWEAPWRGDLKS